MTFTFAFLVVILLLVALIITGRMTPLNALFVVVLFLLILWLFGLVGAR